jgi:hypothetical protein
MTPQALAEAGSARAAGGTTGAKSERRGRGARRTGVRSEQRKMRAHGRDGHSANVEWGGLTAARRCETCDGRASRKIFLRGMGESYGESAKLVGPAACAQARETASDRTLDLEHYRLLGVCMF